MIAYGNAELHSQLTLAIDYRNNKNQTEMYLPEYAVKYRMRLLPSTAVASL